MHGSAVGAQHAAALQAGTETPIGDAAVPRMELTAWAERYGLVAGITTRGVGAAPYSLGLWSDEPVGHVFSRWRAFRAAFAPRFPTLVLSHQVHGNVVQWHETLPEGWLLLDGFDGHATGDRGTLLTITVADCIPVYLAVPEKGEIHRDAVGDGNREERAAVPGGVAVEPVEQQPPFRQGLVPLDHIAMDLMAQHERREPRRERRAKGAPAAEHMANRLVAPEAKTVGSGPDAAGRDACD